MLQSRIKPFANKSTGVRFELGCLAVTGKINQGKFGRRTGTTNVLNHRNFTFDLDDYPFFTAIDADLFDAMRYKKTPATIKLHFRLLRYEAPLFFAAFRPPMRETKNGYRLKEGLD